MRDMRLKHYGSYLRSQTNKNRNLFVRFLFSFCVADSPEIDILL